ncbi:MAG: c-type cytochrome [Deltaproteobacteria bacterium]|nr:c-type cytochrome [Deltaproteobacteria bacterium]
MKVPCSIVVRGILSKVFYSSLVLLLSAGLAPGTVLSQEEGKDLVERGRYIFAVAGGCACHTVPKGTPHAGGRAFPIPFGTVYATNITQDKETGIGTWSDKEILNAMTTGTRPNGERILPIMPHEAYSGMAEEDLKALIAYLRTLRPVRKETPRLKTWIPFYRSLLLPLWLKLFGRYHTRPATTPKHGIEGGRYLVENVSLCGDCHTPRNFLGVSNRILYLAGAKSGPLGQEIPNITPDKKTGIGEWSREQIAEALLTGIKADQEPMEDLMAEVIEGGYKHMKREDALAIADYLKSIPPVANKIR